MLLVVSYDIQITKKRNSIVKFLKKYGRRIQFSVFEVELESSKVSNFQGELEKFVLDDGDSIIMYKIKNMHFFEKWRKSKNLDHFEII